MNEANKVPSHHRWDAIKFYVVSSAMVLRAVPHDWADVITHTDDQWQQIGVSPCRGARYGGRGVNIRRWARQGKRVQSRLRGVTIPSYLCGMISAIAAFCFRLWSARSSGATILGQCSEDYFNLEVMGDPLGAAKGVVLFSAVSTSVLASSTVELV